MTDPDELELRWPRVVGRLALYGMLLVVLYVLSIGPAFYMFSWRSDAIDHRLFAVYSPLFMIDSISPDSLLGKYVSWWMALPGAAEDQRGKGG